MRTTRLLPLALAAALSTVAGCATPATAPQAVAATDLAALDVALAGDWRTDANIARDRYRHPRETLAFFGVRPGDNVVEITPGGGWYAEILAPYLHADGRYLAALVDPMALPAGGGRDFQQRARNTFDAFVAKQPARYDRVQAVAFDPAAPRFGADGAADAVLTFRNVHNWVGAGTAQGYFDGFFRALKPGGVLGVVEHRANPGTDMETMKKSGYLTEALVIDYATRAGFVLEAKSEVNANPADAKDHPNGVWTLPPSNRHDEADRAKYATIGESDRMTLRFRKPRPD
ncbi:class I SAM-dependent methyltransferase [Thermomonas brevis]